MIAGPGIEPMLHIGGRRVLSPLHHSCSPPPPPSPSCFMLHTDEICTVFTSVLILRILI